VDIYATRSCPELLDALEAEPRYLWDEDYLQALALCISGDTPLDGKARCDLCLGTGYAIVWPDPAAGEYLDVYRCPRCHPREIDFTPEPAPF